MLYGQSLSIVNSEEWSKKDHQEYLLDGNREVRGLIERPGYTKQMEIALPNESMVISNPLRDLMVSADGNRYIAYGENFDRCGSNTLHLIFYDQSGDILKSWDSVLTYPWRISCSPIGEVYVCGVHPEPQSSTEGLLLMKFDQNGNYRWSRPVNSVLFPTMIRLSVDNDYLVICGIDPLSYSGTSFLETYTSSGVKIAEFTSNSTLQNCFPKDFNKLVTMSNDHWQIRTADGQYIEGMTGPMPGYSMGASGLMLENESSLIMLTASFDQSNNGYLLHRLNLESGGIYSLGQVTGQPSLQRYQLIKKLNEQYLLIYEDRLQYSLTH